MMRKIFSIAMLLAFFTPGVFSQKHAAGTPKIDTIKRNDFIVYNVTVDTVVEGYNISVNNKNIDGQYVIQYFNLDRTTVIANYYPELMATINITKNNTPFFNKVIVKKDLPGNPMGKHAGKAIIENVKFESYYKEDDEIFLKAVLKIPNTDYMYDYEIKISKNGTASIRLVDYGS